jgi:hypothetical protein
VSSALIALPARNEPGRHARFRFAGWQPQLTTWQNVGPG